MTIAELSRHYGDFAQHWARGTSPLYEDWAAGISADDGILNRLIVLPPRLQQPNLLFASARWVGVPMQPFTDVRDSLLQRWDDIVEIASARSVQTNEPNRCATLLPVLAEIDGPVALLEVGTAGGLCLFPDRYGYRYVSPDGERVIEPDDGASAVRLECRIGSAAAIPTRMPEVVWRRGIDLAPIDVADPDAVAWLATLIWPGPDHDARVARLRSAAAVARAEKPEIVAGDLLDLVGAVAATSPPDATLVVFHSAVLMYLDQSGCDRFSRTMAGLAHEISRRVVWVSNETTGVLPDVDAALPVGIASDHRFVQSVNGRIVALAGQHGATYEPLTV